MLGSVLFIRVESRYGRVWLIVLFSRNTTPYIRGSYRGGRGRGGARSTLSGQWRRKYLIFSLCTGEFLIWFDTQLSGIIFGPQVVTYIVPAIGTSQSRRRTDVSSAMQNGLDTPHTSYLGAPPSKTGFSLHGAARGGLLAIARARPRPVTLAWIYPPFRVDSFPLPKRCCSLILAFLSQTVIL